MEHNNNTGLHLRAGKLWSKGLDSIMQSANSSFQVCFGPNTNRALINNQDHTKNSSADVEVLGSFILCWSVGLLKVASSMAERLLVLVALAGCKASNEYSGLPAATGHDKKAEYGLMKELCMSVR